MVVCFPCHGSIIYVLAGFRTFIPSLFLEERPLMAINLMMYLEGTCQHLSPNKLEWTGMGLGRCQKIGFVGFPPRADLYGRAAFNICVKPEEEREGRKAEGE